MSSIINIKIENFERLSIISEQQLLGGFSISYSSNPNVQNVSGSESNNCLGGNCTPECGVTQNMGCNTIAGCHN